jgi:hypothetical protein
VKSPRPIRCNFDSDAHALASGALFGALLRGGANVEPNYDGDGNYTPTYTARVPELAPGKRYLVTVQELDE